MLGNVSDWFYSLLWSSGSTVESIEGGIGSCHAHQYYTAYRGNNGTFLNLPQASKIRVDQIACDRLQYPSARKSKRIRLHSRSPHFTRIVHTRNRVKPPKKVKCRRSAPAFELIDFTYRATRPRLSGVPSRTWTKARKPLMLENRKIYI